MTKNDCCAASLELQFFISFLHFRVSIRPHALLLFGSHSDLRHASAAAAAHAGNRYGGRYNSV